MLFAALKTLHVLGAVLFLGAGMMTAYYKFRADRSGDLRVIAWTQREIVKADWRFTVPSAVTLPVTGVWLAHLLNYPLTSGIPLWGILGFTTAGALWLPAVWLQIRMRNLADEALERGEELPPAFHRANAIWLALGVPAFLVAMFTVWIMTSKWTP